MPKVTLDKLFKRLDDTNQSEAHMMRLMADWGTMQKRRRMANVLILMREGKEEAVEMLVKHDLYLLMDLQKEIEQRFAGKPKAWGRIKQKLRKAA